MTGTGVLHIASCLFLALIVTLVLGIIEHDNWSPLWRSAVRRWLKLIGALIAIGLVVQVCTMVSEKNRADGEKSLDDPQHVQLDQGSKSVQGCPVESFKTDA
jgi:hypothetical protein